MTVPAAQKAPADFHAQMRALEERGLLTRIDRPIGKDTELHPLMRALFVETNPIPIKAAMAKLGLCREELRLPLVPLSADARKKLWAAMAACPLLGRRK